MRRYWRNYLKLEFKVTKKAFHEPRGENKMKTRQNDLDKLKDRDLDNKVFLGYRSSISSLKTMRRQRC